MLPKWNDYRLPPPAADLIELFEGEQAGANFGAEQKRTHDE